MRALVATRSVVLDDTLWRARYSLEALQATIKALDERGEGFLPKLHPILDDICITGGDTFDKVEAGSRWPPLLLSQNVQICKENAFFPPTQAIHFKSEMEHACRWAQISPGGCTDHSKGRSAGETVTVEMFVKCFLASLSTSLYNGCPAYRKQIMGKVFTEWGSEDLNVETGEYIFEDPFWDK